MWVYYKQVQPGDWPRLAAAAKRFAKAHMFVHLTRLEWSKIDSAVIWADFPMAFRNVDAWVAVSAPEHSRKRIRTLWRGAIRRATGCKIADHIRDGWIVFWQKEAK